MSLVFALTDVVIVLLVLLMPLPGCDYIPQADPDPKGTLQFDPVSLDGEQWFKITIADAANDCWGMREQDGNLVLYRDRERAGCYDYKCTPLDHIVVEIDVPDSGCPEMDYQGLRLKSCRLSEPPEPGPTVEVGLVDPNPPEYGAPARRATILAHEEKLRLDRLKTPPSQLGDVGNLY